MGMRPNSAVTAVLLVCTLLAAAPAAGALEFPPPIAGHPAACHDSIPENPPAAPRSHQCCAAGHDWAVTVSREIPHPAVESAGTRMEAGDPEPLLSSGR